MSPTKDSLTFSVTSDVIGRNEKQGGRAFRRREFGGNSAFARYALFISLSCSNKRIG
jgi:hypothetical protein